MSPSASHHVVALATTLSGIEAVCAETARSFTRHTHDRFGIGLIHRGAQSSASGRGLVEAVAGDLITVNPGEVHDGHPLGGQGRAWRMLYLEPELIGASLAEMGANPGREFPLPVLQDRTAVRHFRTLFASLLRPDAPLAREGALLGLIAAVMTEPGPARRRQAPPPISRARAIMDDDPARPHTLADLAAASGLSRFQVLRGFEQATGLTPHAYLMQRRLAMARRLIAAGMPLAAAAAASGFADQSHMTRLFARAYGLTPGAYAAAMRP
ncbi:AraC family transcriptional regulator [Telmatospirillum sp. J64-1]|uniref:AraC family transcriptional regulator n=1 Tax=Telmatospirillum sp. J64-1 TaxID=2502183 RepID=UPI00115F672C|nr:AraC family transcriptional regulator [Telmatospirillum sp. J64-1]